MRLSRAPLRRIKDAARRGVRHAKESAEDLKWMVRATIDPSLRYNPHIEWLFILTLPNAGSTALYKLLSSASSATSLHPRGEGQWLSARMSAPQRRWNPNYHPNYAVIRAIWLNEIARRGDGGTIVIEKSPPNMCRHQPLVAAFSLMKTNVITYTRDPYATCASWHRRYGRSGVAWEWGFDKQPESEAEYFEALGRLWVERMRMLDNALQIYELNIRYEDLCAAPAATIAKIAARVPGLADANPDILLEVKDYHAQRLTNMNEAQIGALSASQRAFLSAGLRDGASIIEKFGYNLLH